MKQKLRIFIFILLSIASVPSRAVYSHLSSEVLSINVIDGYVTVRIYANFTSGSDQLTGLYGNASSPMSITADGGQFYQNLAGGGTSLSINPAFYPFVPELEYDSWITIGDEDQVANVMSSLGVNYSVFESGGSLFINDPAGAGLFAPQGSAQCLPVAGKVLIAQLTINSPATFTCNLEWFDELGAMQQTFGETIQVTGGIPGCNDPYALNYDPQASFDDGSCIYNPPGYLGLAYEETGQNLIEGFNTYRIYATFLYPNEQVAAVFGQDITPLQIVTTGVFYQHPLGAITSDGINPDFFALAPELQYDSWVTIGSDSGPNGVETINVDGTLFESGGNLNIADADGGAWYVLPDTEPLSFPDAEGKVLIAQLTSNGDISIQLNLQYRSSDGTSHQELSQTLNIPFVQNSCPGDFTADGQVGSADLLIFLAGFGCLSSCNTDLTGDDQTGTADLLLFLSLFGSSCL